MVCACCGGRRAAHGSHGAGVSSWVCRTFLGPVFAWLLCAIVRGARRCDSSVVVEPCGVTVMSEVSLIHFDPWFLVGFGPPPLGSGSWSVLCLYSLVASVPPPLGGFGLVPSFCIGLQLPAFSAFPLPCVTTCV